MEPIALIGMGCRFPRAGDPEAFWRLLRDGVDAVTEVPADRWDAAAAGTAASRWGGFLEGVDRFDAGFFGISPREAERMDPQQRLVLEVVWEALEDAGIVPGALAGSRTGVFLGISSSDYHRLVYGDIGRVNAYNGTGTALSIAANRVSYQLDLRGPSLAVDTACSSSLVAVHLACQSLRHHETDLCLTGGVNLILTPETTLTFSQAGMLAADGRCKVFDAAADGYVRGEGCGIAVLRRLSDAVAAGDEILAVLRGSAVNQDGLSNGLTAPNGPAQQAVVIQALEDAGLEPAQIGYVEAHGSGTALGDPIELNALRAVLARGRGADQVCCVGSVKTAIGHLEAAAGIAGLIKVALMLRHGAIPPHLHLRQLNPRISLRGAPIVVSAAARPWPAGPEPRRAGVSAFGFGGTNCHVVLEEAPAAGEPAAGSPRPAHLLVLAAREEEALRELACRFAGRLGEIAAGEGGELGDLCRAAAVERTHFECRLATVAGTAPEMARALEEYAGTGEHAAVRRGRARPGRRRPGVAFLFTGQGEMRTGLAQGLYASQPVFRAALDRCDEILRPHLETPLLETLYPVHPVYPAGGAAVPLHDSPVAQPILFAVEHALVELWRSWGIEPDACLGHSLGQYAAACAAGVFSLEDALPLVAARNRQMHALPRTGAMVALRTSEERVAAALGSHPGRLAIAAVNGPGEVVVSGEREGVLALAAELRAEGIETRDLGSPHAFHSPLMEPLLPGFAAAAARVRYAPPRRLLIADLTGEAVGEEFAGPEYWCRHLLQPVRFASGLATLRARGFDCFVEIGPKPVLCALGRHQSAPEDAVDWLPSLRPGHEEWGTLLASLGALHVRGVPVAWEGVWEGGPRRRRRISVPGYPFQRRRHWLEGAVHPLLGRPLPAAPGGPRSLAWQGEIRRETLAAMALPPARRGALLPLAAYAEIALAASRELGGGTFELADLAIERPLAVPADGGSIVRTVLLEEAAGAWRFQALSLSAAGADGFILHASGRLLPGMPAAAEG
jgi:acyl transferase domain-containing protein